MNTFFQRLRQGGVFLLVFLLLAGLLSACGQKDISGTYRASYNMLDMINDQLESTGLKMETDVNAEFVLTLNADKTFIYDIDSEAFQASLTKAMEADGASMITQMLSAEGISEDMFDWVAQASGYETFDAFRDDILKEITSGMGDDMLAEIEEAVHFEGTYELNGDTLTLSGEDEVLDQGTLQEDGSIVVDSEMEGVSLQLVFRK